MHGACGCISNAHQTNSLMCPSHRKSSEQLYVYVSLFIHINTYHIYIKITYNLDYISMPTFCCLKEKKSPLAVQPSMSQPRLRVPRRHAKVPPGRLSADTEHHRPMAVLAGRVSQNGISLQTRLAYGVCFC